MAKLTQEQARYTCERYAIDTTKDFHALPSDAAARVLEAAQAHGYRKPRNANGSRARYFHAYLCRLLNRKED